MKKVILSVLAGIILSVAVSFFSHKNSLENLGFHLGLYNIAGEEKAIEETLKLFNKHFGTFFNTGGKLEGLSEFPASNLIKRRIFQEINEWTKKNQILVYDKDSFKIEEITLFNSATAIAVAKEVWFLNVQERDTRKKISPVKANPIRVRYVIKKLEGMWRVVEYEVFSNENDIPALTKDRLLL